MAITFKTEALEPADVILSTQAEKRSSWIRFATKSPYSHAMLYTGNTIVHAVGRGVWTINPQRLQYAAGEVAVFRFTGLSSTVAETICDNAHEKAGSRYSTWEAVLSTFLRLSGVDALGQDQYCSRLIAKSFAEGQIRLVKNPNHCFPSDLVAGPGWTDVTFETTRLATPLDDAIMATPDTLAEEGDHFFAWLRPLDWWSTLTLHGRVLDAKHAWQRLESSRFLDRVAEPLVLKSGCLADYALDRKVNLYRYDALVFLAAILTLAPLARKRALAEELLHAAELSSRIEENLDTYRKCKKSKTIRLFAQFEKKRAAEMVKRLQALIPCIISHHPGFTPTAQLLLTHVQLL